MHLSTGWETTDNIFILRQIIEKVYECDINLNVLLVDFKQVFDSIIGIEICEMLQQREMPAKLIILIKTTMEHSEARIILENDLTEKFSIFKGVRQGDTLLTVRFNITLDLIIKKLTSRE
jgi:Reverse transcriptase (RNA-dependent DNA polymerase).